MTQEPTPQTPDRRRVHPPGGYHLPAVLLDAFPGRLLEPGFRQLVTA